MAQLGIGKCCRVLCPWCGYATDTTCQDVDGFSVEFDCKGCGLACALPTSADGQQRASPGFATAHGVDGSRLFSVAASHFDASGNLAFCPMLLEKLSGERVAFYVVHLYSGKRALWESAEAKVHLMM